MKIIYFFSTNTFEGFQSFNVHILEFIKNSNRLDNVETVGFRPVAMKESQQAGYMTFYSKLRKKVPRWFKDVLAFMSNFIEYKYGVNRIKEEKPDVIFFRYNFMNIYQIFLKRKFKLPLVLEVNAPIALERRRFKDLFFFRFAFFLEKISWRNADKIHVVSAELKRMISEYTDHRKIFVAHNGVNPDEYFNIKKKPNKRVRIGFVGSFGIYHGIDVLFDAIPVVLDEFENVEFYLIGKGGLYEKYKEFFSNSKYDNRVRMLGYVPRERIPHEVANFDISTMLDFTEYGSPLKMFEYMMAETAMLLPDRKTIHEVIEDGVEGIFFKPRDKESFIAGIRKLLKDDMLRKRIAENARKKVVGNYTWLKNAETIVNKIKGLCGS